MNKITKEFLTQMELNKFVKTERNAENQTMEFLTQSDFFTRNQNEKQIGI